MQDGLNFPASRSPAATAANKLTLREAKLALPLSEATASASRRVYGRSCVGEKILSEDVTAILVIFFI